MSKRHYKKKQRKALKRAKSVNTLTNDIEIPLRKKKIKSVSIVVNAIKLFLKMKNKG